MPREPRIPPCVPCAKARRDAARASGSGSKCGDLRRFLRCRLSPRFRFAVDPQGRSERDEFGFAQEQECYVCRACPSLHTSMLDGSPSSARPAGGTTVEAEPDFSPASCPPDRSPCFWASSGRLWPRFDSCRIPFFGRTSKIPPAPAV